MAEPTEGVIRFCARHTPRTLDAHRFDDVTAQLSAWRQVMVALGGIGQDPARYQGAGYGNLSARVGPYPGARGRRAFVISGTQTGGDACASGASYCAVTAYDFARNTVESFGPVSPSSESMTHGAIYDLGGHVRVVLHAHSPTLFAEASALRLPTTDAAVEYGTPQMAREISRLALASSLLERQVLVMGGHQDGVVAFGRSFDDASAALLRELGAALELRARRGPLCFVRGVM